MTSNGVGKGRRLGARASPPKEYEISTPKEYEISQMNQEQYNNNGNNKGTQMTNWNVRMFQLIGVTEANKDGKEMRISETTENVKWQRT